LKPEETKREKREMREGLGDTAFLWEATDRIFPAMNIPVQCPPGKDGFGRK
jgi:hypothetical protein